MNANVGSFGSSTSIPTFTVNAKGLVTAASGNAVVAPAGTLTGTTLNATVVTSSLTAVGDLTAGSAGTGFVVKGVTMTLGSDATGDMYYRNSSGVLTRIATAAQGSVLRVGASSVPAFGAVDLTDGDAYSGTLPVSNGGTGITSFATGVATWLGSGNATDLRSLTNGTTGTAGNLVFSVSPTLTTPDLGAATATSINGLVIASTTGTLTLANNLTTSGNFALTLTQTGTTNVTLPTSGTLATLAGAESLTNKKLGSLTTNGYVKTSSGDGTLSVQAVPVPIADGGTNNTSAYTAGSVVFSDGSKLTQDNASLFFDDTNNRLGIGTAVPRGFLDVNNSPNLGTPGAGGVSYYSFVSELIPTITTVGGSPSFYNFRSRSELSGMTFSPTLTRTTNVYGNYSTIEGIPVYNASGKPNTNVYGIYASSLYTPTLTAVGSGTVISDHGGFFQVNPLSAGLANLTYTAYGIRVDVKGNLTTTGTTAHYGSHVSVDGTADDNYGLYLTHTGAATNNYGLYIDTLGAAATNFALYSNSAAQSYLAGNLKMGGTAVRGTTEGTVHLDLFDGTAPVGTLTNGVSLYSEGGECKVMDAGGNATQLSPHNAAGEWVYFCQNTVTGRTLKVDMERLVKDMDKALGGGYVHESQPL